MRRATRLEPLSRALERLNFIKRYFSNYLRRAPCARERRESPCAARSRCSHVYGARWARLETINIKKDRGAKVNAPLSLLPLSFACTSLFTSSFYLFSLFPSALLSASCKTEELSGPPFRGKTWKIKRHETVSSTRWPPFNAGKWKQARRDER